jgi:hypothetical protein
MTLAITHSTVVVVPDDGTSPVGTDEWNAAHTLTGTVSVAQGGTGTSTALTQGSVIFAGASGVYSQNNTNLNWDDTNHILKVGSVAVTYSALNLLNSLSNVFIGGAGLSSTTGVDNIGIGDSVFTSLTTGHDNTAIGFNAAVDLATGSNNVCLGSQAGKHLTGGGNFALGTNALAHGTANNDVAIGTNALVTATSGGNRIAIGASAGAAITTDQQLVAIGGGTLGTQAGTTSGQTAIGYNALVTINSATGQNTAVGYSAGSSLTAGDNNTLIGGWTGPASSISNVIALSDGAGNLKFDYNYTTANVFSFQRATSASTLHVYNTYSSAGANYERAIFDWQGTSNVLTIGTEALGTGSTRNMQFVIGGTNKLDYGVTTASIWSFASSVNIPAAASYQYDNVPFFSAQMSLTNFWFGGGNFTATGTNNVGVGIGTLTSLTTGSKNVAIGVSALVVNTTGAQNMAIGQNAMAACQGGADNVAIGYSALSTVVSGTTNVALGSFALNMNTGSKNIGIGGLAGYNISTGNENVVIGTLITGTGVTSGSDNTIIGVNAGGSVGSGGSNVIIGASAGAALTGGNNNCYIGTYPGTSAITGGDYNTLIGGWAGPAGSISNTIALSDGAGNLRFDYNYTTANVFSFQRATSASTVHVYNTYSGAGANYERGIFDWQGTANVLTIGTEQLGTGSTRNMQFVVGGTNKLDYGITNAATWTSPAAICVTPVAVASLPTVGIAGRRHFVNNATATTFASIVAGGGANLVPVYDDGTNWRIG